MIHEMDHVFADGIGGALVPGIIGVGLFGSEDFNEAAGEMVELIGLRDVAVKGSRVELSEQVDTTEAGVDAVGNRDIDEAIFAGERDRGFGAFFGERKEASALAAAHDNGEDVAGVYGLPACM